MTDILDFNYRRLAGSIIIRALMDLKCVKRGEQLTYFGSDGCVYDRCPYPKDYFSIEFSNLLEPEGLTPKQREIWFKVLDDTMNKKWVKRLNKFFKSGEYPVGELDLFFYSDWFKELSTFIGFKITPRDLRKVHAEGKINVAQTPKKHGISKRR